MSAITNFSGSVPDNYERYLGPLFFEPYAIDLAERMGERLYTSLLELACGTGRLTKHLLEKVAVEGTLHATDLSEDMLRIAREKVSDGRLVWAVADAHELPFDKNRFEAVVCQYGVMFFADKPKALKEVWRVLQRGGVFYFNTWDRVQENAISGTTESVLQEVFPDGPPSFFEKGPYSLYDADLIRQLLQEAGFEEINIERVTKASVAATPDEAIRGILDGTPLRIFLDEHQEKESLVRQKLREQLIQRYGEQNLELPMQAFVCSATKPM